MSADFGDQAAPRGSSAGGSGPFGPTDRVASFAGGHREAADHFRQPLCLRRLAFSAKEFALGGEDLDAQRVLCAKRLQCDAIGSVQEYGGGVEPAQPDMRRSEANPGMEKHGVLRSNQRLDNPGALAEDLGRLLRPFIFQQDPTEGDEGFRKVKVRGISR